MYTIPKGLGVTIGTVHISEDFDCHCTSGLCRTTIIRKGLLAALDAISILFEEKIVITSAYRCPTHNSYVGGAPASQHMQGNAVDLVCPEGISIELFAYICRQYFSFVLVYKDKNVCHCDVR